ncbi:unnamed protein product [marine sediment metagenome]|uniref:Uncharacterized protein n=1 Tax=marine sediment metagenome TaxID=412755 RepID=X1NJC2_9ZZZZ
MVKVAHKPPSRVRYEQSHPTMSCRLDKVTHDLLEQRLEDLGGVSFADFVKDSLGLLQLKMPDVKEIKATARGKGYNQARTEYRIWYLCAVCREPIYMLPNSDGHKAMIGYMKEHGWGHASCHEH